MRVARRADPAADPAVEQMVYNRSYRGLYGGQAVGIWARGRCSTLQDMGAARASSGRYKRRQREIEHSLVNS